MGLRVAVCLVVALAACRADDRVTSVRDGATHVFTIHVRFERPECFPGYDIERLDHDKWVSANVWYRIPKDGRRWVDEGPPSKAEAESYVRCEPMRGTSYKGEVVEPPWQIRWSGNTIEGPAPHGRYRLVLAGGTSYEFEH